jgi:hypothetical protein
LHVNFTDTANVVEIAANKWFVLATHLGGPVALFVDAPFGRFAPKREGWWTVDGEFSIAPASHIR